MPWHQYYCMLAVSLELDERDRHWKYVLAGGDPKKWPWRTDDHAGTRQNDQKKFWDKVTAKFGARRGHTMSGDIGRIAQDDWEQITKVTETHPDGSVIIRYENEHGEDITERIKQMEKDGHIFMGSKWERP